jgi:hypothetical protein
VPPFTGNAVNVTGAPAHAGLNEAEIETLTGSDGLTIIVIVFEVAGFDGQFMSEVRIH